jgi:hypothetical protein
MAKIFNEQLDTIRKPVLKELAKLELSILPEAKKDPER